MNHHSRGGQSRGGGGQFPYRQQQEESYRGGGNNNEADDELFLMKVIASRMDQPSAEDNNNRINDHSIDRRDYSREQDAFMRSLEPRGDEILEPRPDWRNDHLQSTRRSSSSRSNNNNNNNNNNPALVDQPPPTQRRRSTRIADVDFEDPFFRKVIMERGNHNLQIDEEAVLVSTPQRPSSHEQVKEELDYFQQSGRITKINSGREQTNTSATTTPPQKVGRNGLPVVVAQHTGIQSEPGAFASLPRRASSNYSLPGAYPQSPSGPLSPAEDDDGEWETLPDSGQATADIINADSGVFTATVSVAENEDKAAKSIFKSTTCIVVTLIGLIAGATAIVIGVLFAINNKDNPEKPDSALAPTLTKPEAIDAFLASLPSETTTTIRKDPTSPQAQAFDWLVEDINFVTYPTWRLQQRFTLATIYMSLQLESSVISSRSIEEHAWLHYDKSECEWLPHANPIGACDGKTGKYRKLELQYLSLMDDTPVFGNSDPIGLPAEVSLLTSLESISLSDMAIPPSTVSDFLPSSIYTLPQLETLSLVNLQLSGTLPSEVGLIGSLRNLELSGNQISGSLPKEWGQLEQLETLHLEENRLSGSLASEVGLLSNLELFYMQDNNIGGSLPHELGNLSNLHFWKAERNSLTGSIVTEIGLLTNLQDLRWNENQMTGSVPQEMEALTGLTDFGLLGNEVTGEVPRVLCSIRPPIRMRLNCSMILCCGDWGADATVMHGNRENHKDDNSDNGNNN